VTRVSSVLAAIAVTFAAHAADVPDNRAQALRERYAASQAETASPFGLPLQLRSSQQDAALQGDIDSRLDHPFATVREALRSPEHWCEIMILHPNVKNCRASGTAGGSSGTLLVHVGRAQHAVRFDFRVVQASDSYVDVRLDAPSGPAGTTDYRIRVEAAPLAPAQTVLHLAYSHGFGSQAKAAMNVYFATFGRDKVGFSVTGHDAQGAPQYVGDLRGGLERNAMRYYLAIRSHLEVLTLPRAQRLEQGLRRWIAYIERWPLQLAEEPGYAEIKRRDFAHIGAAH
jgi:hypothetical protein